MENWGRECLLIGESCQTQMAKSAVPDGSFHHEAVVKMLPISTIEGAAWCQTLSNVEAQPQTSRIAG